MSSGLDGRVPSLTKPGALVAVLIVLVVAFFWLWSRYPAIDEKAAMAGDTLLEDVLSFEAKLPVRDTDPLWQQIAFSTLNWSYTNKEGMTFGVVLAALILTFLRLTPRKPSGNVFLNSLKGTLLGAPLGVCVNCATPISKGMYRAGASMETSLATLLSSPTLNIIVIAMTFSLFPLYMAVAKVVIALVLLLFVLPLLVAYLFRPEPRSSMSAIGAMFRVETERHGDTWAKALISTGRELAKSFWYIVVRTVPLMLLAGFLGVTVATLVPLEALADWEATLPNLLFVALVGTFLPVPIAFDVVVVQALLLAGLRPEFAMVLLVTLGSYSIYPVLILWNTMPRRVAVVLFLAVALLGVGSGYFAQGYERYKIAQSNALVEAHFAERATLEYPGAATVSRQDRPRSVVQVGSPAELSSRTVYRNARIRVEAVELAARRAPLAGELPFTSRDGSDSGVDDDRIMVLDFMIPFSQGRGIASGDFDNDGWMDLALASRQGVRLYRNLGIGRFSRVPLPQTDHLNVTLVAFVDIDNDGWQDLYLGAFGDSDYFVLNDRRAFASGKLLPVPHNGALFTEAASFFDLDKDGDLDFVKGHWFYLLPRTLPSTRASNYLVWNKGLTFEQSALDEIVGETLTTLISDFNGDSEPDLIIGNDFMEPDIYYTGRGDGRFDQLFAGGPVPISTLATMSVDTGDINNDLVLDIYLTGKTNYFSKRRDAARSGREDIQTKKLRIRRRNQEFDEQYCVGVDSPPEQERCQIFLKKRAIVRTRNMRACKTLTSPEEVGECMISLQLLKAQSKRSRQLCSLIPESFPQQRTMCDAYLSYFETGEKKPKNNKYLNKGAIDQARQGNVLLVGSRDGKFMESAKERGVYDGLWSWNAKFADLDNDQWQDLYVANGWWLESRVYSNKFFRNHGGKRFESEEKRFGLDSGLKESSYTYVDIDNDGDLDLVTRTMHGTVKIYTNNEYENNIILFEFRDRIGNTFGIGNKIYIYYGDGNMYHQIREIKSGSGYLSFDAPYAHFGLGPYSEINKLVIIWSTGEKTVIEKTIEAGKKYIVSRESDVK
jgi:uncharacterized membrane protein YraQ (UPF0718 family)